MKPKETVRAVDKGPYSTRVGMAGTLFNPRARGPEISVDRVGSYEKPKIVGTPIHPLHRRGRV